mmetsp:Transcript_24272/g.53065  ORF Transcript_24272/g.53065 Transcript_24272/m.53065 type:complete len:285 (-) Transcript_24272:261-1115(-)|eukprot:CAMPEP_0202900222 /NCGR_PEP_ID=MMETSP1392-20130828/10455_1 /ASSEMBLY_ACC=CAM_ASM_000868 /TAXON_ID=225041 /ORGANISM="Chlamydomonas chlamydogama, Strain SAG 11-48b" /LENGTH=284 /DNA_ID=CAMNT_0049586569 /DNA_START=77 /DNA_END=931 /DNA_ORIENTATION=+
MANIKSFGDLGGEHSSDDDGGDFNDYYAGGEKSGQLIRGAPVDKDEDKNKVSNLFDKARKAGAVQGTAADLEKSSGPFNGSGRTVAGRTNQTSGPVNHIITFYQNNVFTVDDGPPRRVDDPANFRFIDSISKGECPEELEVGDPNITVTVNLVRKEEDYTEPEKPKYTAFQGSGRTLAGSGASSSSAATAAAQEQAAAGEWEGVNESQPTTSLQLRLADGSRMVARFNNTHKISDIRRFIRASRPEMTGGYQLMTAFPSQLIEDEGRTLADAGLLNAVIIQKKV